MAEPVLLEIPGVETVEIEKLLNFINSEANRPIDYVRGSHGGERSPDLRYVKLLDMKLDSPEGDSDPSFRLSLHVLTEHGMRRKPGDAGFKEGLYDDSRHETPRSVIEEVLDRLGILPKTNRSD